MLNSRHLFLFSLIFSVAILLVFWEVVPGSFGEKENRDYVDYYRPVAQSIMNGEGVRLHGEIATAAYSGASRHPIPIHSAT